MSVKTYLAGPIKCSPHPTFWRLLAESYGDIDVTGPKLIHGSEPPDNIVQKDKQMIVDSDVVLARVSDCPMIGTPMEILFAYECDIPVVVWWDRQDSVSPWASEHAVAVEKTLEQSMILIQRCFNE